MASRPWWCVPSYPTMSPSSANPAATAAPLRLFQPSRNCGVQGPDLGVVRVR